MLCMAERYKDPMQKFWKMSDITGKLMAAAIANAMYGFIAMVFLASVVFNFYADDLPDYKQLSTYEPPVTTRLYAADGRLLAEYASERRIYVPFEAIPRRVLQAFISAEDKNFYQHKGVDPFGILRAVIENVKNYGSGQSMVGGSTITQQVVKNFLLTNEKSLERKIKEAILAHRISKVYSKDRILELYLNEIFLGMRSYGIASAALNFFNKTLNELTVEEAALLAAMPKAPSAFNPNKNYNRALERRNYVIARMQSDGYISEEQARIATGQPILLENRQQLSTVSGDFYAEEVRRVLVNQFGEESLYRGGLSVKTALDPTLQKKAEKALRDSLIQYDRRHGYRGPITSFPTTAEWPLLLAELRQERNDVPLFGLEQMAIVINVQDAEAVLGLENGERGKMALSGAKWARKKVTDQRVGPSITSLTQVLKRGDVIVVEPENGKEGSFALHQVPEVNGAMVVMDPHTGKVKAMVGGYSYGSTEFNRATQARRQPGSAFKPFVYMSALERGFSPSTIVLDVPIELEQGPGLPLWKPQNYDGKFLGPTTLRVGLEKSRNAMTVQLAQMVGLARVFNMAERFNIYKDLPRNMSAVLGSHETTLLRLTNAYAMIVNGGKRVDPSLVERIDDRYGRILYRADTRTCEGCNIDAAVSYDWSEPPLPSDDREQIIDPRVAYQAVSILEGVVQRGTATGAKKVGKPLAGKTGTTNDNRDTWFIGFSPDLVAGVYIGFDAPRDLGDKETGGRVALPAFVNFMEAALKDVPATPFRIPRGIRQIRVDRFTGLPPAPTQLDVKLITESFLVGDEIYIPAEWRAKLAAEEQRLREANPDAQLAEPLPYDPEGFNPYAERTGNGEWRDVAPKPTSKQSINSTPTRPVAPYVTPDEVEASVPFGQATGDPAFYAAPQAEPVAPPNPYLQRREQRRQQGFDPSEGSSINSGTGGIY